MDEDELKQRTKLFGLRIIKLVAALPNTVPAKVIGGQLVRRSRSKVEFIARLGVVEKKLTRVSFDWK